VTFSRPEWWGALTALSVVVASRPRPTRRLPPDRVPSRPALGAGSDARRPGVILTLLARADLGHCVRAPGRTWAAVVALGAVTGGVLDGGSGAVLGALVGVVSPPASVLLRGDRTHVRIARDLPVALDAVAAAMRSGTGPVVALADGARAVGTSPVGADLLGVVHDAVSGVALSAALQAWAERRGGREVRLAAAALSMAVEVGGPQARTVDEVAAVLREQRSLEEEVRVQAAQARASATVIGLAPLAFAAVVVAIDPDRAAAMWTTPVGAGAVVGGLLLEVVGLLWMRRIVAAVGVVA
jgi:tight adherence protein B